jgi:hypothetical protein
MRQAWPLPSALARSNTGPGAPSSAQVISISWLRGARHPEHLGAGHVGLQDPAVEGDHEIADRRQQVELVEVGLLLFVTQTLGADTTVELLEIPVHSTPRFAWFFCRSADDQPCTAVAAMVADERD